MSLKTHTFKQHSHSLSCRHRVVSYLCTSFFVASSIMSTTSAVLATAITCRPRPLPTDNGKCNQKTYLLLLHVLNCTELIWDNLAVRVNVPITQFDYERFNQSSAKPLPIISVCKIDRNHGWSNGPTMVALWVVRSILGGPLKIRVNFKSLHCWHMDFKIFFLCGLHTTFPRVQLTIFQHWLR